MCITTNNGPTEVRVNRPVSLCYFVSDLHGAAERYQKLFSAIRDEQPRAVFIGGDLLPPMMAALSSIDGIHRDFINDFLADQLQRLRDDLGESTPRCFIILGNDDQRIEEAALIDLNARGLCEYLHSRRTKLGEFGVYGYACVPPSPFLMKDWERYDVSRHVDPGCVSPEDGWRSVPVAANEVRYGTIKEDLELLAGKDPLEKSIWLFHAPPYQTALDRAALDGKTIDYVPLDVHIGSIAIQRFIQAKQPLVTLHGHVHESTRLTGEWRQTIGRTHAFNAAHDGPELALIRFDPAAPESATRSLL